MALTWSHTVMYIRDEFRMLDFYTRVLWFAVADRGLIRDDTMEIIFLSQVPNEHHQLAFIPIREDEGQSNSVDHMAFRTDSLASLRSTIEVLKNEDVPLRPVSHANTWSVYFQDPEQNGIEIFCDTPWYAQQPIGLKWDLEQKDEELERWTLKMFEDKPKFGPNLQRSRRATDG